MARSYKFAIVRLAPDDARDERINIGAVVLNEDGLDVRVSKRLERVRALSAAIDSSMLRDLTLELRDLDHRMREAGAGSADERLEMLSRVGPLTLSRSGTFSAENVDAYEARLASIMRSMVEPEPAAARIREKRSRLLTQMKKAFRRERVLAQPGEDLKSHRIVSAVEMDEGLVADLVLKNGAVHIVETVDASGDAESPRKALGDIGIAALVLERGRMKYGDEAKTRLVYTASAALERIAQPSLEAAEHQGAELVNWASVTDRVRFIDSLASYAQPVPHKRRRQSVAGQDHRLRFT
jgi:hypothetical protein